jgi:hypothetical protein
MLEIDHVLIAVSDLDGAAQRLREEHGLESIAGGRHPGWGTGNRIVPLGREYLELIGVVDPAEAAGSPFGSWLMKQVQWGDRLLRCCLRPSDIEETAGRLGVEPEPGSRVTPAGQTVAWRLVGLEAAISNNVPFFIEWDAASPHPGQAAVQHPSGALGIAWVEIGGDPVRLLQWVGEEVAALRLVGGQPGIRAVGVITR